jgi:butyryl-CoA dehydrogenase
VKRLIGVTAELWAAGDIAVTLANSTLYLEATGHIVMSRLWLEQMLAAGDKIGDFYDGKRAACNYFFTYELPRVRTQLNLPSSLDRSALDFQSSWF